MLSESRKNGITESILLDTRFERTFKNFKQSHTASQINRYIFADETERSKGKGERKIRLDLLIPVLVSSLE